MDKKDTKQVNNFPNQDFAVGNPLSLSEKVQENADNIQDILDINVNTELIPLNDPANEMENGNEFSKQKDANIEHKTRIDTLNNDTANLQSQIDNNSLEIIDNQDSIVDNENDILVNTADITNLKATTLLNTNKNIQQDTRLDTLEDSVLLQLLEQTKITNNPIISIDDGIHGLNLGDILS